MSPQKSRKSVSFANTTPEVRTIPDYMGTWAIGELCLTATEEQERDSSIGARLARESYAMASAMLAEDAAASGEHSSALPPSKSNPTPQLQSILQANPELSHLPQPNRNAQPRRKPIPARAQSMKVPPQSAGPSASRPPLHRAATNHRFGDFLDTRDMDGSKEDMRARRASLHPFEDLTVRAMRNVKKVGLNVKVSVQKKLVEKMV